MRIDNKGHLEHMSGAHIALITATSAALLTLIPVAAHQLGLLSHFPDPPSDVFASDEITESSAAHPFGIPDSLLGLGSYGATLALVVLSQWRPLARRLLVMKLLADGSVAGFNVVRQVASFGKICSWCTGTALCTAAMLLAGCKLPRGGGRESPSAQGLKPLSEVESMDPSCARLAPRRQEG